jgi:L-serine dehydratase
VSFVPDSKTEVNHPNTVDVLMEDVCGHTLLVRGESIGGGRVRITRMNDIEVDFTGENSTMIIGHQDVPGMIAFITHCLAEHSVNIASLKNFRKEAGKDAITVVEDDGFIPEEVKDTIMDHKSVVSVDLIEL